MSHGFELNLADSRSPGVVFGSLSCAAAALHSTLFTSRNRSATQSPPVALAWYSTLLSAVGLIPLVILSQEIQPFVATLDDFVHVKNLIWGVMMTVGTITWPVAHPD